MKKIILFTRLTDNAEWNAWCEILNNQPQNNSIEFKKNDITLKIINGQQVLGQLPGYDEYNPLQSSENANKFINNLYNQINNETDPSTIIAIHFGGGVSFDRLMSWLDYLSKQAQNQNARYILENFSLPDVNLIKNDKPELKAYSIGYADKDGIKTWIKNITNNLTDLSGLYNFLKKNWIIELSLLKHQIVNLLMPIRIDIEGLIDKDFEDKYCNSVLDAWKNNKINEVFKQVRELVYDRNKDTIEKIILEKGLKNSETWKKIEENLLPNLTGDESVNQLLNALQSGKKEEVQKIIELHGNVYKQWMDKLINAIDQLINKLVE